jgi:hypothetical protein
MSNATTNLYPKARTGGQESLPPLPDLPDPGLEMYQYETLPTPTSIRLLKFSSLFGHDIRCSMVTIDLEDDPGYAVVSYTWGASTSIFKRPETEGDRIQISDHDTNMFLENVRREAHIIVAEGRTEVHIPLSLDTDALLFSIEHPFRPFEKLNGIPNVAIPYNVIVKLFLLARVSWKR